MSLPEAVQEFLDASPVSLVAGAGGPLSIAEIKSFYESEIAPQVTNQKYGQICYAGLLMAQDFIWEAHEIVQDYPEVESSWWHAYMHRMEGDYGNSAYWYRRVGDAALYSCLQEKVDALDVAQELSSLQSGSWDPYKCNDLIQEYRNSSCDNSLQEIHRLEWSVLFGACLEKAIS
jgi:hypothetical protein